MQKYRSDAWNVSDNLGLENKLVVTDGSHFAPPPAPSRCCESDRDVTNVRSPLFSTLHPIDIAKLIMAKLGLWGDSASQQARQQSRTFQTDTDGYKNKFQSSDAVSTVCGKTGQSTDKLAQTQLSSRLENRQWSARCRPIKIDWPF